jgi:hypothetical protein
MLPSPVTPAEVEGAIRRFAPEVAQVGGGCPQPCAMQAAQVAGDRRPQIEQWGVVDRDELRPQACVEGPRAPPDPYCRSSR